MTKNSSIHLQNFPNTSFINNEKQLVADMDMVRDICTAAFFIRDKQNLRVRLPLNKLTIIGKKSKKMLEFKDIIADEINVKNIEIIEEIGDLAETKLQINFKKVGAKFGSKMKEISIAAKQGDWKKIDENSIKIAGETLKNDDFEIKLTTKDENSIISLPSNDCLVQLDLKITKELEEEGIARDIIRSIQQNRKDADFDVSDHIEIAFVTKDEQVIEVLKNYDSYIKEQVLGKNIKIFDKKEEINDFKHQFCNKIDKFEFEIGINSQKN